MADPEDWTADEMKGWLRAVCSDFHSMKTLGERNLIFILQRNLLPNEKATREELLERVKANLRIPRNSQPATSKS